MKIYLAGASSELDRCEAAMADLRRRGHVITEDWCAEIRASLPDSECTEPHLRRAALADFQGITDAEAFVLLVPLPPNVSVGCWTELGYAQREKVVRAAFRPRFDVPLSIIWVGEKKGPFWTLVDTVFPMWDDFLESL